MKQAAEGTPGTRAVMRREIAAEMVEAERVQNGRRAARRLERRLFAEAEQIDQRDRQANRG